MDYSLLFEYLWVLGFLNQSMCFWSEIPSTAPPTFNRVLISQSNGTHLWGCSGLQRIRQQQQSRISPFKEISQWSETPKNIIIELDMLRNQFTKIEQKIIWLVVAGCADGFSLSRFQTSTWRFLPPPREQNIKVNQSSQHTFHHSYYTGKQMLIFDDVEYLQHY